MTQTEISQVAARHLDGDFKGVLIYPGDAAYDEARAVFNGMIDRRPALIARCTSGRDVAAALKFVHETGLAVAVRAGGHSVAGYGTCDDGIVIDLSPMKGIQLDAQSRTVRAGAGLTWAEFDAATQEHGLAVTGGRVRTTGISGLTLGSGSGWLERKLGWTADSLLAAEVVTADGSLIRASESENADLFWGLRGGSGNFGVVTSFEFRLHPIGPTILGGMLVYTRERARDLLRLWRDWIAEAPEDMGSAFAAITAPPEEFVPAPVRGTPVVAIVICWTGDADEGQKLLQPLRDFGPGLDMVGQIPYTALQSILDAANPPGLRNYWKADMLSGLPDSAVDAFLGSTQAPASPFTQIILEPLGGAISRVAEDATALSGRKAPLAIHALGVWQDPAEDEKQVAWVRSVAEAIKPYSVPGVPLNFVGDEGEERVRSTYGSKYGRLTALKEKYDPTNLFRLNQNIAPTGNGHK